MGTPPQGLVELSGRAQVLQLLQPGMRRGGEALLGQPDVLKKLTQLPCAAPHVPFAAESGQLPADLAEGDAVAAVVAIAAPEGDLAVRKGFRDRLGDLLHTVILAVVA